MERLIIVVALTVIIHSINTLVYSVRPAGVLTRRLATAYSLFNLIFLISQTANMLQAPLLSSIIEQAIARGEQAAGSTANLVESVVYQQELATLSIQIRAVILGATLGTLLGAILIPTFISFFIRAIKLFDQIQSVPKVISLAIFSPEKVAKMAKEVARVPNRMFFKQAITQKLTIPKKFLLLNVFVTGIFTTSVLSSLYAGALFPEFRATATLLSGIINGLATILFATVVDPTAAGITDQVLQGERTVRDLKQMSFYLALSRLLGTLLAQLFFIPAAVIIKSVARIIA